MQMVTLNNKTSFEKENGDFYIYFNKGMNIYFSFIISDDRFFGSVEYKAFAFSSLAYLSNII